MVQKKRTTDELVNDAEYLAAKIKFLKGVYPDLKVHDTIGGWINLNATFSSSAVNKDYSGLEFIHGWKNHSLKVAPYSILTFEHDGRMEDIKIHSSPKSSRLAYITYGRRLKAKDQNSGSNIVQAPNPQTTLYPATNHWNNYESYKILRFGRVKINFKTHAFSDKMMDDCQNEIMKFVGANNGVELDTRHLDERLKKLLVML